MKKLTLLILYTAILLTACSPSENQNETTNLTAEIASPSGTPAPTETPLPTHTYTPIPSPTFTLTPTSTPDIQVLDMNPKDLILERDELPPEGKYYLTNASSVRNWEIVNARGEEEGLKFIEESERIDGWSEVYTRGTIASRTPPTVVLLPSIYQTAYGPEYEMHENDPPCREFPAGTSTYIGDLELGDEAHFCLWKKMSSSGRYFLQHIVVMRYRNILFVVMSAGFEGDYDPEWVIEIANTQMDKLLSLPLSDIVTYSP